MRNYEEENIQKKAVTVAAKENTAYCYRGCTYILFGSPLELAAYFHKQEKRR